MARRERRYMRYAAGLPALILSVVASAYGQGASAVPPGKDAAATTPAPVNGEPSAASPPRVYSADIHDSSNVELGGDAALTLTGVRNGVCSGKVVVVGAPLQNMQATMSDLRQGAAVMPSARVSVRYGVPWASSQGWRSAGMAGTDMLLERPLADFVTGQVALWVTVQVPKSAAAGDYAGELTIALKGGGPFKVPVKLAVQDWALPDTQDYRTWMEVIQSPDTLAIEYKLTPWSEEHWRMIGQSLSLIGSVGSRVIYIPLIGHGNFGNEESMVRWIRRGGGYEQDYTVMEKYLDAVEKNMGKPKIVTLWAWDVHVMKPGAGTKHKEAVTLAEATGGPPVTVYDPATKKTDLVYLPPYETPEGKAQWAPVWKELRRRLEKRGLWDAAMLGVSSDIWPSKEQVEALAELSGGLPWSSSTHDINWLAPQTSSGKGALYGVGMVEYINAVLQFQMTINPSLPDARTYGWQRPTLVALYWRLGEFNSHGPVQIRHEPIYAITGDRRGLGHIGGEFWPVIKGARGRSAIPVSTRYPESLWHSQAIVSYVLAPGPEGPVSTVRFEVLREGVQECEARIAIESVLTNPQLRGKIGDALAKKAEDFLDEHQRNAWRARGAPEEDFQKWGHIPYYRTFSYDIVGYPKPRWNEAAGAQWYVGKSDWAARVGRLYALAGEVEKKVGAK